MKKRERVRARGHPLLTALHPTTLMITREEEAGPRGDCIVAVGADKSVRDLGRELKEGIREGGKVVVRMEVGGLVEEVRAWGHPSLALDHPTDMVVRKSSFVCGRTLAVRADRAAADLSRGFVGLLRRGLPVEITVEVEF
ncbi:MAG: DUF371 domain-containing protein [Candidatus Hadarchaeales archaeon]